MTRTMPVSPIPASVAAPPVDISMRLAEHVAAAQTAEIPVAALHAARRSLLDAVGVSLAATGLELSCAIFRRRALVNGSGACTLIGWGDRVPIEAAALANGALAHAIDFEDVLDESPIHPNACTVAAALAVSETLPVFDGQALLSAIAVGCDLVCRLALALNDDPGAGGWYIPPILGAYGAAAAATSLLGLSAQETRDAFALTLSQVTCTNQFRDSPDSSLRAIRDGFATHAGVLSALLAGDGLVGFDAPFEGRAGLYALYANGRFDRDVLLNRIGVDYRGAEVSYKAWPACRGTHAFIEAALDIAANPGHDIDAIVAIEASGSSFLSFLFEPIADKAAPLTPIAAKFSAPFAIASTLVRGSPILQHFTGAALDGDKVTSLARRVRFMPRSDGFRGANAGSLDIRFADGRSVRCDVTAARGHPNNPISDADLIAKFRSCAAAAAIMPNASETNAFVDAVMVMGTDATGRSAQRHPLTILHPPA